MKKSVEVGRLVLLVEVEDILKKMAKYKSPRPNKWTIEFYIQFFNLPRPEIVPLMEEAHSLGSVSSGVNATFIALILNNYNLVTFQDFHPISLCNLLYKIIKGDC